MSPNSWSAALLAACLLLGGGRLPGTCPGRGLESWGPRLATGARIVEEGHFSSAAATSDVGGGREEPLLAGDLPEASSAPVASPRWRHAAEALAEAVHVGVAEAERAGAAAAEALAASSSTAARAIGEISASFVGQEVAGASSSQVSASAGSASSKIATEQDASVAEIASTERAARDSTSAEHAPMSEQPTSEGWARRLGIPTGGRCSLDGGAANLGCAAGCSCSWDQQCYPKFVYVDGGEGEPVRLDVGTCEAGMPLLVFGSLMLFLATLLAVVVLRLYLLGHIPGDEVGEEGGVVVKASPRIAGRGRPSPAPSSQDQDDPSSEDSEDDSQASRPRSAGGTTPPTSVRGGASGAAPGQSAQPGVHAPGRQHVAQEQRR